MKLKKADMKKLGFWSMTGLKACIGCSKDDRPHNAKGLCKSCYYRTDTQHETQRKYRLRKKIRVLQAYSESDKPVCACCGEDQIEFLSIDHIDGCGTARRLEEGSGSGLYIYLRARNYPDGYQVLCHNCNMAKHVYKVCPHQR